MTDRSHEEDTRYLRENGRQVRRPRKYEGYKRAFSVIELLFLAWCSLAPNIYGHREVKKGILLMLVGGVHKVSGLWTFQYPREAP